MTTRGFPPPAGMRRIRAVVRSETSASPFGRKAIPHGTERPVATVRRAGTRAGAAVAVAEAEGDAVAVGEGVAGGREEPPHATSAPATSSGARRIIAAACGAPAA